MNLQNPGHDDVDTTEWDGRTVKALCFTKRGPDWADLHIGPFFAQGGQAKLWAVSNKTPEPQLAKVYLPTMRKLLALDTIASERMLALVQHREALPTALPFAIWPRRLLFNDTNISKHTAPARLLGVSMNKLSGSTSLNKLMFRANARVRLTNRHTQHIALTLLDQIERLHKHPWRFVFGDLSTDNIHISHDFRLVSFIDTDAFQFVDPSNPSRFFPVPGINPAFESPWSLRRDPSEPLPPEHDLFAIATIVFIMIGAELGLRELHPFTVPNHDPADLIRDRQFPLAAPDRYPVAKIATKTYNRFPLPFRIAFEQTFTTQVPIPLSHWRSLISQHWRDLPSA